MSNSTTSYICKQCGDTFEPRSKSGTRPTFCRKHDCAAKRVEYNTPRTCGYCDAPVVHKNPKARGPLPKWCSEFCRYEARKKREEESGLAATNKLKYEAKLVTSRAETKKRQEENARPCPYCETLMTSPWRVQCGSAECKRKFNAKRAREFFKQFKEDTGLSYAAVNDRRYELTCLGCGQQWETRCPDSKYCSNTCQAEYEYGVERGTRVRGYIADSVRFSVYLRDGWICRLCNESVDRFAVHPEPLAPTIDHIIPVSKGGTDDEYNLRLAHSSCNTKRNVTPDEVWFSRIA